MKVTEKNVTGLIAGFIVLVLILCIFFRIKAVAKENYFSTDTDFCETRYRQEIKEVLNEAGAKNAGITMTKVSFDGRKLKYNVNINLPKYINLNNQEKENLLDSLYDIEMQVENSSVTFSFS